MIRSVFIIAILLLTLTPGAAAAVETAPPDESSDVGGASKPKEASESDEADSPEPATDLVVVRVSGDPITEKQVLDAVNELARQENMTFEQSRQRNSLFFDKAVESLVTISLLKARMREMNIAVDEAAVEAQLRQTAQRFSSPEAFQKSLDNQGLTEDDLRNNLRESIRLQKTIDEASKNAAPVTEAEMEKFYAENPGRFAVEERARVAHILLKIPPDATAARKEEIRKMLEGIRVEIAAETITFAAAAAKYSQDETTAAKGGDMGLVSRDNMPKPFADVLFKTKPGTVSPALESQDGYHILKALELKPAGLAEFEEVKPALRQFLERNAKQSAMQKFVEELKSKATIEYFITSEEFVKRRN